MPRPPHYELLDAMNRLAFWAVLASIATPFALAGLASKAAQAGWKAARHAVDRHVAQVDRDFAKHCTERLQALRGAPPSVWRRALRELARERRAQEDAREGLCDNPSAVARRAAARSRRDEAWRAWFAALEQSVAGSGTPSRELLRRNPLRRGAPIRRLCERSVNPPPTGAALLEQYGKACGRGRVEEKIKLGSMLLDAEAAVDSSLVRDEYGEIVGRKPGLRGWLADNCPALLRHYGVIVMTGGIGENWRRSCGRLTRSRTRARRRCCFRRNPKRRRSCRRRNGRCCRKHASGCGSGLRRPGRRR